jgi:hypothetical protein
VVGVGVRVQSVTDEIADNLEIGPLTSRGNPAGSRPDGARRRDNLLDRALYIDGALRTGCFLHHAVIATASIFSPLGPSTNCTTQVCRIRKQA